MGSLGLPSQIAYLDDFINMLVLAEIDEIDEDFDVSPLIFALKQRYGGTSKDDFKTAIDRDKSLLEEWNAEYKVEAAYFLIGFLDASEELFYLIAD